MNVIQLLDEAKRRNPDAAAIIDGPLGRERTTTFAALGAWSGQIASLLARSGVRSGDGLVVLVPMSATLYAVISAALRLGAVPVFVDPRKPAPQLEMCRDKLPLRGFVGSPLACLWRRITPALYAIEPAFASHGWFPGTVPLSSARNQAPWTARPPDTNSAPAMLTFTSGSTGGPKGLLRDHGLLAATQTLLMRHLGLEPGSINLATMPALVMANLAQGVTSLIPDVDLLRPGRADPDRLARSIQHWGAQSMLASPSLVENLADHCAAHGLVLDSLRTVHTGGAPVFPRVLDKAATMAPGAKVCSLYGSTEAEPIAMLARDQLTPADRRAVSLGMGLPVGRPISEIRAAILEDRWGTPHADCSLAEFQDQCLPAGKLGEIVVSGPHVARTYLNGQQDRETKFQVDHALWHRTGDAGMLDEDGRLWLAGRCAERLAGAPSTTYPLAVEAAMSSYPQLARTAVLRHEGKHLLVLEWKLGLAKAELDMDEVVRFLPWVHIDSVISLSHIPVDKRHNAKIDYPALRAQLRSRALNQE